MVFQVRQHIDPEARLLVRGPENILELLADRVHFLVAWALSGEAFYHCFGQRRCLCDFIRVSRKLDMERAGDRINLARLGIDRSRVRQATLLAHCPQHTAFQNARCDQHQRASAHVLPIRTTPQQNGVRTRRNRLNIQGALEGAGKTCHLA